ncbi:MAG: dihydroorotate dehydrogenase-like protein [Prolixibacteraceae bacterium]|nr:dihydroorotate dehydrogenase-like protein [Prolixibacteraceae bacterium]
MANFATNYMGLSLKNPIVAGSSGLTNSVKQIQQLEEAGVGAVVLKSLFEEQISIDTNSVMNTGNEQNTYPEAEDYIQNYTRMNSISKYLELVKEAKKAVDIPVIASVNCMNASDWSNFAKEIEAAGADALELNIYELPVDRNVSADSYDKKYYDIVRMVRRKVKIPIAVKIGSNFSNPVRVVDQIHANGASSVVLFNKFYTPDFDLEKLEFTSADVMSTPLDIYPGLRWTGIIKGKLPKAQIAASTGIHDGDGVIKQLLAGAQVTQICSTLYLNGFDVVKGMLTELESFMKKWSFENIEDFRGRMSYRNIDSPAIYERSQFMKYYSNKK